MIERDKEMKITLSEYFAFSASTAFAVIVFAGVLASFGFQQGGPGGIGQTDLVISSVNPPTQAGQCYNPTTNMFVASIAILGLCENYNYCAGFATCVPVANITNEQTPVGCNFAKTETRVQVGTCSMTSNTQCAQCQFQLVCHVYKLYATRNPTDGICSSPCNGWVVKFGGSCVGGP